MSEREETYHAIRKALAKLEDPFTRFLEPARYQALKRGNAGGGVTGVGLEIGFDSDDPSNGHLIVRQTFHQHPCLPACAPLLFDAYCHAWNLL